MRGDRPINQTEWIEEDWFTPHARGSTPGRAGELRHENVYPACAGIDPASQASSQPAGSLPRMRGDRPQQAAPIGKT